MRFNNTLQGKKKRDSKIVKEIRDALLSYFSALCTFREKKLCVFRPYRRTDSGEMWQSVQKRD